MGSKFASGDLKEKNGRTKRPLTQEGKSLVGGAISLPKLHIGEK